MVTRVRGGVSSGCGFYPRYKHLSTLLLVYLAKCVWSGGEVGYHGEVPISLRLVGVQLTVPLVIGDNYIHCGPRPDDVSSLSNLFLCFINFKNVELLKPEYPTNKVHSAKGSFNYYYLFTH